MNQFAGRWIELAVFVPLAGAVVVSRALDAARARRWSLGFSVAALLASVGAWLSFSPEAVAGFGNTTSALGDLTGRNWLELDALSAPLFPLVALIYLLTLAATLRTKMGRFSFAWNLAAEAVALATFACKQPWLLIGLLTVSAIPPYRELRARHKPTTVFAIHMSTSCLLLAAGWRLGGGQHDAGAVGTALILLGLLIRCGVAPFHCWVADLFEHATFATSLTFVVPMTGAYGTLRLLVPGAPDWALRTVGLLALITAVYAAGMALVQREGRRFFCYVVLSHSALVLVGLQMLSPIGITGGLCVWLSAALALTGFGLTLRAIESRTGRLSLVEYHGLYEHMPTLGAFFLLTGLASVGFPGTFGFIGSEMLVDGAVSSNYMIGMAVVAAAALNGVAVLQAYFKLFTGTQHFATISLSYRPRERFAVLVLTVLIFGGGIFPQPGATSRYDAARGLLLSRPATADALAPDRDTTRRKTLAAADLTKVGGGIAPIAE